MVNVAADKYTDWLSFSVGTGCHINYINSVSKCSRLLYVCSLSVILSFNHLMNFMSLCWRQLWPEAFCYQVVPLSVFLILLNPVYLLNSWRKISLNLKAFTR